MVPLQMVLRQGTALELAPRGRRCSFRCRRTALRLAVRPAGSRHSYICCSTPATAAARPTWLRMRPGHTRSCCRAAQRGSRPAHVGLLRRGRQPPAAVAGCGSAAAPSHLRAAAARSCPWALAAQGGAAPVAARANSSTGCRCYQPAAHPAPPASSRGHCRPSRCSTAFSLQSSSSSSRSNNLRLERGPKTFGRIAALQSGSTPTCQCRRHCPKASATPAQAALPGASGLRARLRRSPPHPPPAPGAALSWARARRPPPCLPAAGRACSCWAHRTTCCIQLHLLMPAQLPRVLARLAPVLGPQAPPPYHSQDMICHARARSSRKRCGRWACHTHLLRLRSFPHPNPHAPTTTRSNTHAHTHEHARAHTHIHTHA